MKKPVSFIALTIGVALTSCGSLQTISFDQLEAADVSFPPVVRNVAVVNNMPITDVTENRKEISLELDGNGKIASEALAREIADANYFDQVVICDSALRATDLMPRENAELTKQEVRKLVDDLGVDMIFSLDRIHIKTKPGVLLMGDYLVPINAVDAVVTPVIRLYIPNREAPLFVISKQDTISWEINPNLSDKVIVDEASDFAATMPIKHILPHWKQKTRAYFDGGGVEMRDAGVCLRENDWDGAYTLWKSVFDEKKGQAQMKSAFNLALYYEMKDDISKAKEYLEKALKLVKPNTTDERMMQFYMLELNERENQLTKLNIQMNRFGDNF